LDMGEDRSPDQPLSRIVWGRRLAPDAQHALNLRRDRPAVAAKEDHGRRPVAGDVGARGVDNVGEVDRR
jgi:hypothetical protein